MFWGPNRCCSGNHAEECSTMPNFHWTVCQCQQDCTCAHREMQAITLIPYFFPWSSTVVPCQHVQNISHGEENNTISTSRLFFYFYCFYVFLCTKDLLATIPPKISLGRAVLWRHVPLQVPYEKHNCHRQGLQLVSTNPVFCFHLIEQYLIAISS